MVRRRRFRRQSFLPRRGRERRRTELLGGVALVLFSVTIGSLFLVSGLQKIVLRSSEIAAVVSAILVDLANEDRATHYRDSLTTNPKLVAVAQAKANDMVAKNYFAHVSPEGFDSWYWFREQGYAYKYAGENLAVDFSDSGDVERAWMDSPTHRENILNENYTEIGIASAQGMYKGRTTTFVVQMFGAPAFALEETIAAREVAPESSEESNVAVVSDVQVLGSADSEVTKSAGIPVWGYIVGFPRDSLRYAYYLLGLIVLFALALDTGLEFRGHHRARAARAGALLLAMLALFVAADYLFFAEPVLAQVF